MSDDVPAELRTFISEHIGSIVQLELLLLLAADPQKSWSSDEAAKVLYVSPTAAFGLLEGMRARGLLEALQQERFRFVPQNADWGPLVAALAAFYKERRLTVIDLIYNRPVDKFQSFADAFRIRRPKEN